MISHMRPWRPLPESTRGRTTNRRGKTARAKSTSRTPGASAIPDISGGAWQASPGLLEPLVSFASPGGSLIAIPETFSISRGGDFSMFSPSINSIGPRDVRAVATSMMIRMTLAPRYTHHEGRRSICSRVRFLGYSPRLCEAYGVYPPAASRARHAHPGDRGAPGTPGGTEHPNFFFRARRARHGVAGHAYISRDRTPPRHPQEHFRKGSRHFTSPGHA
jgi:hypothetical protein